VCVPPLGHQEVVAVALKHLLGRLRSVTSRAGETGQGGLEYALVAGVVVVAIIVAFDAFPVGDIVTAGLEAVQGLIS
jgi:Flp pilus assembly pilin Flp